MKIKNNLLIGSLAFILLVGFSVPQITLAEEITPTETTEPTVETNTSTETTTNTETTTTTESTPTETVTTTEQSPDQTVETTTASSTEPIILNTETATSSIASTTTTTAIQNTAQLTIRVNDSLIFSGSPILDSATTTVTDKTGAAHDIAGNSVLGLLHQEDERNDTFAISKIGYFAGIGLYIECITVSNVESCNNWQYTVNDVYSYFSVDANLLKNSDDVYLYFGNQNQFSLATTTVTLGEPLLITVEKYDYRTNTWAPRPNVTVGATQFDPANPWSPIVVTSTLANELGLASLYISTTGTFDIGIGDDYYYPTQAVTVVEATTSTAETVVTPTENTSSNGSGGSSNNSNSNVSPTFDVPKAIEFLTAQQDQNTGAIGSASLYSDWAAVAVGSYTNAGGLKDKLAVYLRTDPNPGTSATDFERRAMALMSLGINPYSGTKTDYIHEILKTYQSNQFGDSGLVNDDIFALIPLLKAGYTTSDPEIKNSVAFILTRQNSAGGWESPDLTAAAVQALSPANSLPGVSDALLKAKNYLKLSTKTDGRIGDNTFSTSWGIQALNVLGESTDSSRAYLATQQQTDGGLELLTSTVDNRIWSTSYAIPAAQNKAWPDILMSFPKVTPPSTDIQTNNNSTGTSGTDSTTTTAPIVIVTTTTPAIILVIPTSTTSTPVLIDTTTSTPAVVEIINAISETAPTTTAPVINTENKKPTVNTQPTIRIATPNDSDKQATSKITVPNTSGEILSAPGTRTPVSNARGMLGGAAAVAGSAAAYLAWRFAQSLV